MCTNGVERCIFYDCLASPKIQKTSVQLTVHPRLVFSFNQTACKAGTTEKGQVFWPIFQLAALVFFRAGL